MFTETAKTTLGTYTSNYKNKIKKPRGDKPWFNIDCNFARQNYRKLKRRYKKYPSQFSREQYKKSEKEYKKLLDKTIKNYRKNMATKKFATYDPEIRKNTGKC